MPDIGGLRIARHTKADARGIKAERPGTRLLPRSRFEVLDSVHGSLDRLFGTSWRVTDG